MDILRDPREVAGYTIIEHFKKQHLVGNKRMSNAHKYIKHILYLKPCNFFLKHFCYTFFLNILKCV